MVGLVQADTLTLPLDQRPEWLARDGIVMAGSWEPLLFRVRRDGSPGYTPTPEQRAAYVREHSPEMVARLKALGVNFVMMHCYKAFGMEAERESMADAVRFSKLCRDAGLRVGVYNNSGTLGWELFFKEKPEAEDWVVRDRDGKPRTYGRATYRYYWNRNHPDAEAFYRNIVRFSVNEIRVDLLHFDNYHVGPGSEAVSAKRFREYLRRKLTPAQREGIKLDDADLAKTAMAGPPDNLLRRAWLDFVCQSLADSYHDMGRYARTLRPDVLVECNPGGVRDRIHSPVDHGRLLTGGEAFWDEGRAPGFRKGKVESRIRTYKVARAMKNMTFAYTTTPLEMAESMAFNRDCLGCICWFEYDKLVAKPGSKEPVSKDLDPFIRFFKTRRDLFRDSAVVADVAVFRSFPSQMFADRKHAARTNRVEQALIEARVPFQIVYEHQLDDLKRHRALVLAGCVALSDDQIKRIAKYVASGGRLCVVGPAATHDEWMIPRAQPGLTGVDSARITRVSEKDDFVAAVRKACDGRFSFSIEAPTGLCAEFMEQSGRRLIHLVNYRPDGPVRNVAVRVRPTTGQRVSHVTLVSPERTDEPKLSFEEHDDAVTFTVPTVNTYEVAVIVEEEKE